MTGSSAKHSSVHFKAMALLTGFVLTLALLAWASAKLNADELFILWRAVPFWGWVTAALMWSCTFFLRAVRLRQEWRWKRQVRGSQAMRLVLFHNAAVLLTPLRAGELGYPLLVRQMFGASWQEAMHSLMWLRLQDLMVLGLLALILWPGLPLTWRVLFAIFLCSALLVPRKLILKLLTHRPSWSAKLSPFLHGRSRHSGWWLSLGNWAIKIAVVASLLHAMTPKVMGLSHQRALAGALGGELAALLPVQGPAGLGTYEAGVWLLSGLPLDSAPLLGMAALLVHGFCLAVSLGLAGLYAVLAAWGQPGPHKIDTERLDP